MDPNKLWKILKDMGIPDHITCLLGNLYAVRKHQLEPDMEQQTGSKLGKEYVQAVYHHLAYLTYMQGESESHLVVSSSLRPHGLYSTWNSPGQNTGVGSLSFPHEIFPTQGLNPGLLHCRKILYQLSHK